MKFFYTLLLLICAVGMVDGQELYVRSFGDTRHQPIIFLHGGPGYNSANFEFTTSQALAETGYFVIVYDRRGEGRSNDPATRFTFTEVADDLLSLYQRYGLQRAILIGHSFGGLAAVSFAKDHRDRTNAIILVGAPLSIQQSCKTIIETSKKIYQQHGDTTNLKYLAMLEKADTASLTYLNYCLHYALQNGFYTPEKITDQAKVLRGQLKTDTLAYRYVNESTTAAPQGFWKNEHYTTLDLSADIQHLKAQGLPLFAIYGRDDGLYSAAQLEKVRLLLGDNHVLYLDDCSHHAFIDQQQLFLRAVYEWTGNKSSASKVKKTDGRMRNQHSKNLTAGQE